MKLKVGIFFFSFLILQTVSSQVNGYMIFKKGVNVTFNFSNLNKIQYGIKYLDFSEIDIACEDEVGGVSYAGFAIYVNTSDLIIDGNFGSDDIPLSKIKFTCTGDFPGASYVNDTSMLNSKLSTVETAIGYWPIPGEGVPQTGTVKISYYCEPLKGFSGDIYLTDLNISIKSYTTAPF